MVVPRQDEDLARARDRRNHGGRVGGRTGAAGATGRADQLPVARGAQFGEVGRTPLRADGQRTRADHLRDLADLGRPRVDRARQCRRAAVVPHGAGERIRRAIRLHDPDRAARLLRRGGAPLPRRRRGGRQQRLLPRPRAADRGVDESSARGGGAGERRAGGAGRLQSPGHAGAGDDPGGKATLWSGTVDLGYRRVQVALAPRCDASSRLRLP